MCLVLCLFQDIVFLNIVLDSVFQSGVVFLIFVFYLMFQDIGFLYFVFELWLFENAAHLNIAQLVRRDSVAHHAW